MSARILFGFHAVTVRLKTAPESVLEIHLDASRRDARMRQFVERARAAGAKLVDSSDAQLGQLAGTTRHQGWSRASVRCPRGTRSTTCSTPCKVRRWCWCSMA
jgi:tRNA G18 (ribose-2'-O)-methylase SpoU